MVLVLAQCVALSVAADAFMINLALSLHCKRLPVSCSLGLPVIFGLTAALGSGAGWSLATGFLPERFSALSKIAVGGFLVGAGICALNASEQLASCSTRRVQNLKWGQLVALAGLSSFDCVLAGQYFQVLGISAHITLLMGGGTTVILSLAGWKIGRLLHRRTGSGRHRLASGFVIVVGIVVMVY